jgi:Mg-chelatase subunit ChlD
LYPINKKFTYFPISIEDNGNNNRNGVQQQQNQVSINDLRNRIKNNNNELLKRFFPDILKALGSRAIKENTPTLQELEQYLQTHIQELMSEERIRTARKKNTAEYSNRLNPLSSSQQEYKIKRGNQTTDGKNATNTQDNQSSAPSHTSSTSTSTSAQQGHFRLNFNFNNSSLAAEDLPIVSQLIERGYLVDSNKWLKKKGFLRVGQEILTEIIKSLKADKLGMHETHFTGSGDIVQENSKRYEQGNETSNIHINSTIQNFLDRKIKNNPDPVEFPLDITYEDLEIYETIEEIQVATVYCIDLSSTMKYSSMYNDLSRIEAAKRALWSLYILNKKFFPLDSIYLIGFGSVASKIDTFDIPFLKTFETNADFLHYTNYQAAYRLAKKILRKNGAKNKRIVMITDGHPSACFIDNTNEKEKISKQRPYSHFYIPDQQKLNSQYSKQNSIKLEIKDKQIVYLCYRYRQIDQYIGEQTIKEAKKIFNDGINIDTIMVSEDDTLLDFINELAKSVNGKSIYINPKDIDKILIKDYLSNKKKKIRK